MQATIETRLKELRDEYSAGQKVMAELQNRQAELHQTLLRISGAIQVLEELLPAGAAARGEASPPTP
jgi:chromosome segregation ATPase